MNLLPVAQLKICNPVISHHASLSTHKPQDKTRRRYGTSKPEQSFCIKSRRTLQALNFSIFFFLLGGKHLPIDLQETTKLVGSRRVVSWCVREGTTLGRVTPSIGTTRVNIGGLTDHPHRVCCHGVTAVCSWLIISHQSQIQT